MGLRCRNLRSLRSERYWSALPRLWFSSFSFGTPVLFHDRAPSFLRYFSKSKPQKHGSIKPRTRLEPEMDTLNSLCVMGTECTILEIPLFQKWWSEHLVGESEKVTFLQRLFIFKIKSKSPSRIEKTYYDLALVNISSFIFYHSLMDPGLYPCWCTCSCQNVPCSFFFLWLLHMLFVVSGNSSRKCKCLFLWESRTRQR